MSKKTKIRQKKDKKSKEDLEQTEPSTNKFSSDSETCFPEIYSAFADELKETLRRRGKFDP